MNNRMYFETKFAHRYICPWRDAECLGDRCIAWVPDDDLEHLGVCALVPAVEA